MTRTMVQNMFRSALINQERRASFLYLLLLAAFVFPVDLLLYYRYAQVHSPIPLAPYVLGMLAALLLYPALRRKGGATVKYAVFLAMTTAHFAVEIFLYVEMRSPHALGRLADVYFLLFAPIFVNTRFFATVFAVTFAKYMLLLAILDTPAMLYPMGILVIVSVVATIVLFHFRNFMAAMNQSAFRQMEAVVKGIVSMIELKDPYTSGHSERVAKYAVSLANMLKIFTEHDLAMIHQACLLHDVGKIHVPDSILLKPDRLSESEMEVIRQHPVAGARAISHIQGYEMCKDVVLHHHERWDGKGYPDGLREMRIPLTARIVAIADAFDAMTTKRAYREAMTAEEALAELVKGKGSQFDPALVEYVETHFGEWKSLLVRFQNEKAGGRREAG